MCIYGRSRRARKLLAALVQNSEGAGIHRVPVGRFRDELQALVAANRELIEHFEQKIATTLARIWGDLPDINAK